MGWLKAKDGGRECRWLQQTQLKTGAVSGCEVKKRRHLAAGALGVAVCDNFNRS